MNVTHAGPMVNTTAGFVVPIAPTSPAHAVEYRGSLLFPPRAGVRFPCWFRPAFGELDGREVYGPFIACDNWAAARVVERKLQRSHDDLLKRGDALASIVAIPQGELLPDAGFAELIAAYHLSLSHTRIGDECCVEVWLSLMPEKSSGSALLAIDLTASRVSVRYGMEARR